MGQGRVMQQLIPAFQFGQAPEAVPKMGWVVLGRRLGWGRGRGWNDNHSYFCTHRCYIDRYATIDRIPTKKKKTNSLLSLCLEEDYPLITHGGDVFRICIDV